MDLSNKIHKLESQHKQSLPQQSATELLESRKVLRELFETKRMLFFKKNVYYEAGDKTGKFLARALKEANAVNHISSIRSHRGTLEVSTEAIAAQFHQFYSELYNLPQQHKP